MLQEIIAKLRKDLGVFRTTLRLDTPGDEIFPVQAESLGDGAESIKGPLPFDLRTQGTYVWLAEEQRILVQNDCSEGPNPPTQLMEVYGVGAQLLAPLIDNGNLIGIISVHHAATTREWTDDEVGVLEQAAADVQAALASAG